MAEQWPLGAQERRYKALFERCGAFWRQPAESWAALCRAARGAGVQDIPADPPTRMDSVLTEADFFTDNGPDAVCFRHLRYCPAFLHRLECIKILYVRRGSATLCLDDEKHELNAGNFCILTPGIRHTVSACSDEDVIVNLLTRVSSFAGTFSALLMEQNCLSDFFWQLLYTPHSNRALLFFCPNDPRLDRWIEKMLEESARKENAGALLMKSYVMIFLGLVMRDHLRELHVGEAPADTVYPLPAILQAMRQDLKTITPEALCSRFHMGGDELKRYIVDESGYTYRYLLRDLRLRRAAELLRGTNWSTEQILEEIGYSNSSHFYRSFKERFGKTPRDFRQSGGNILI